MGISERREREKQELREKILDKAREILIKEGQDNLSIRNIATAIEYSPATIYLYFKDKDEIVYELMEMGFARMRSSLGNVFEINDPVERIRRIGQGYVDFGLNNPEWYDIMFNAPQPIQHINRCQVEWGHGIQLFDYLVQNCEEAMEQNRTRRQDPRLVALHLWSTVHGLVNLYRSQRLELVEQNQSETLIHRTMESMLQCIFN